MIPAAVFIAGAAAALWWMKRTRRLTDPPRHRYREDMRE